MSFNTSKIKDHALQAGDFNLNPSGAEWRKSVSTTAVVFSGSNLDTTALYGLTCYGADGLYTLDGSTPTFNEGTGSAQGNPLSNGVRELFVPQAGTVVTVRTQSGTADFVFQKLSV